MKRVALVLAAVLALVAVACRGQQEEAVAVAPVVVEETFVYDTEANGEYDVATEVEEVAESVEAE